MKDFNWVGFKKGEFYVFCETREDSKDFLEECENRGYLWSSDRGEATNHDFWSKGGIYYYCVNEFLCFSWLAFCTSHVKWKVQEGFTWEGILKTIQEGETYVSKDKHISLKNGCLTVANSDGTVTFYNEVFTKKEEPKPINFTQALKALEEGEIVRSNCQGFYYKLIETEWGEDLRRSFGDFECWTSSDLTYDEIIDKWFIIK